MSECLWGFHSLSFFDEYFGVHSRNCTIFECWKKINLCFTQGHGYLTSRNLCFCVFLYPAIFMACHPLLWILLGVITEPFWGFTVLVAAIAVYTIFFFLVSELHCVFPAPKNFEPSEQPSSDQKMDVIIMSCILSFAVLSLFVTRFVCGCTGVSLRKFDCYVGSKCVEVCCNCMIWIFKVQRG